MMRNEKILVSTLFVLVLVAVVLTGLFGVLHEAGETGDEAPAEPPLEATEIEPGENTSQEGDGPAEDGETVDVAPLAAGEGVGHAPDPGGGIGVATVMAQSNDTSDDGGELAVTPHPGPNGEYAVGDGEDLGIELLNVNPTSETMVPRIFEVSYSGDGQVEFWVEAVEVDSFPGDVRFFATTPGFVWFDEDRVVLTDGETAEVGVYVSSFDAGAGDTVLEEMVLHAEAVEDEE